MKALAKIFVVFGAVVSASTSHAAFIDDPGFVGTGVYFNAGCTSSPGSCLLEGFINDTPTEINAVTRSVTESRGTVLSKSGLGSEFASARALFSVFDVGVIVAQAANGGRGRGTAGAIAITGFTVEGFAEITSFPGALDIKGTFSPATISGSDFLDVEAQVTDFQGRFLAFLEIDPDTGGGFSFTAVVCTSYSLTRCTGLARSSGPWEGSISLPLVVPSDVPNGVIVDLFGFAQTDGVNDVTLDFSHTATLTFSPPPGTIVRLATGEVFGATADSIPTTTTATPAQAPNANGWNNTNVTINLAAADDPGGSGVKEIHFSQSGAQGGAGVVAGSRTAVTISAEGTTTLTFFAVDNAGNQEAAKTLTVRIDKTPPVIAGLPASCTLWPPNRQMVQVATVAASDALSGLAPGSPTVTGTGNEAANGLGDGNTAPDIVITGSMVQLRAERSGTGAGRIYTLAASASDLAGNVAIATATCTVPHDQRN
ncbi:MAG TPA: hypothetical protein VK583_16170 [Burkholderiales bacterium]|nr:hypothetical protein [Burkholderiales bacterium]